MSDILIPNSVSELLPLIDNKNRRLVAGATDIMVALKVSKIKEMPIIDLNKVGEIKKVFIKNNDIFIGSNVTLSEIINNNMIKVELPLLVQALKTIGSPQIRNRATLGGNIGNASPSGDGTLASFALKGRLLLKSARGEREVSIKDFIVGVGKNCLEADEFIEYIIFERAYKCYKPYFEKVGLRNSMVISIASLAMLLKTEDKIISDVVICYGAVAPSIREAKTCENYLIGKELTKENISEASVLVLKDISPITDVRASKEYRERVCENLLFRLTEL